jgi:hypothetical protein
MFFARGSRYARESIVMTEADHLAGMGIAAGIIYKPLLFGISVAVAEFWEDD